MENPTNKQNKKVMKLGNVILSGLIGFAAGTIVGILYAPKKGSKTRKQILLKGEKLSDDIIGKYDELGNFISEKFDNAKKDVGELVSNGISKFNELKNDIKFTALESK